MSFDGTWNVTINSPMGAQQGALTLATDGGAVTGRMDGAQGGADLEDGKVDGNSATWTASLTSPMPLKLEFTATVDGDSISGDVKLGAFGNATFSGTRG